MTLIENKIFNKSMRLVGFVLPKNKIILEKQYFRKYKNLLRILCDIDYFELI